MGDVIGLAASAAGGGLFGLIGTALGRVAGFFERRQEQVHERARWGHESALVEMQMRAEREAAKDARELADTRGRWTGLAASIAADEAIAASYAWVDAVRGLTRPALTVLLWLIAGGVYLGADAEGRAQVVETATFAATAATLWWFGDRGPKRG